MEIVAITSFPRLKLFEKMNQKVRVNASVSISFSNKRCISFPMRYGIQDSFGRARCTPTFCYVSGEKDKGIPSSQYEDFSVVSATVNDAKELKISVEVCGTKTNTIFDSVFQQMVADAQPIPGFRRVKGGKTPNIPLDVLLKILGPSNVYKQAIKKIIDSTVAEYVHKEGLLVSKELRVEQRYEDLEATFQPGHVFCFDAILGLFT